MKYLLLRILVIYKKYFSWGSNCRFSPSCSQYMYQAIKKYGTIRGGWLGIKRILRCGFWSKGGLDLLK